MNTIRVGAGEMDYFRCAGYASSVSIGIGQVERLYWEGVRGEEDFVLKRNLFWRCSMQEVINVHL